MSDKATCVLAFVNNKSVENVVNTIDKSDDMIDPNASLWLWNRDKYKNGALSGTSWRIAFNLEQNSGWQVRNEIAFACKVADPAPENRLKRGYEKLMHLVRTPNYYYDRTMGNNVKENLLHNKNGILVTRSGLTGTKYLSQIMDSPFLTSEEKVNAINAWKEVVHKMDNGEISDFRMILRGIHKATKTVSDKVDKFGFYVRTTKYHSPTMEDLWTSFYSSNNSSIPEGVLLSILRLSCPMEGVVLDLYPSPFVAKTVVAAGRTYIAKGLGEYSVTKQKAGIFENEEVNNGENTIELSNQKF